MDQDNMKKAYIHAGLFTSSDDTEVKNESVRSLLSRYVRKCLCWQSGSVYNRNRNLVLANAAFSECLLGAEDELVMGTPRVLQSAMRQETTEKINSEKRKLLAAFLRALYSDLLNAGFTNANLPNRDNMETMHSLTAPLRDNGINVESIGVVDYVFPPEFAIHRVQSFASYTEQKKVLQSAKHTIDRYMRGVSHKNVVICGGPGNGKTTVCQEICLYAMSRGLKGIATSIVADRSKALGGMHIHLLCAIPISDRRNMSPGRTAEAALISIYRRPELLHFWQELQFLYIDEFGAVSAELLATMDIIARSVKDSSRFLGGILVICSMNIHQLMPIDGTALMLSMNMMTEFHFTELTESVRAARDANLCRLCRLTRISEWDDNLRNEFREIVTKNCNFVSTFDDAQIPEDGIYVFGRRAPCESIENVLVKRMENEPTITLVMSPSEDEESSVAGNWKIASSPVAQELSRKLKQKKKLYLYKKGRYEFTHNLHGSYQQGQLAILLDIDEGDVDAKRNIELYKGKPGCKEFPLLANFNREYLKLHGWEPVAVPFQMSKPKRIWGRIVARRAQYGIRLQIASTIHASQGATFGKLVTAVCNIALYSDLNFALWDAAQVVVLLSRTRHCSDVFFVGRPDEVVAHLLSVLEMTSKYMAHITSITQRLCSRDNASSIIPGSPLFRPCDIILDCIPAVYLLVSTRSYGYLYIGETVDVRRRLNDHNSGQGSGFTNNERLLPWALFGYVHGLVSCNNRRNFEQRWKRLGMAQRNAATCSPVGMLRIAQEITATMNRYRLQRNQLQVQQCGSYELEICDSFRIMEHT
ncbi:unnamed protein product [Cylindrotheca closterium]|uniref:ATP-dependent DNA helicase n=1 Tax=Cylindrotheca closterium TaxID=2856 RepID=A0AAD2G8R0_9STRA|nr:unnamed protein product [Cylindrotheca closterium]